VPTRLPTDRLEIVGEMTDQFRSFRWKNVSLVLWLGVPSARAAREHASMFDAVIKSQAAKLSTVSIVAQGFSLPDAETRAVFAGIVKTHAERLACVSIILPGTGFWVSAVRSFATGLLILGRRAMDLHVDASAEQVARWLPESHHQQTGVALDATELRDHINTILSWQASSQ
jgi:hypothetical protein